MAKRLSTKEILEAARKGGAAKPADEGAPAEEPVAEAEAEAAVEEQEVAAEPSAAAPAAPAANVPTPSSLGRPADAQRETRRGPGRRCSRSGGCGPNRGQAQAGCSEAGCCGRSRGSRGSSGGSRSAQGRATAGQAAGPAHDPGREAGSRPRRRRAGGHGCSPRRGQAGRCRQGAGGGSQDGCTRAAAARKDDRSATIWPRPLVRPRPRKPRKSPPEAAAKAPPKPAKAGPAKPQTVPPRPTRELAGAGRRYRRGGRGFATKLLDLDPHLDRRRLDHVHRGHLGHDPHDRPVHVPQRPGRAPQHDQDRAPLELRPRGRQRPVQGRVGLLGRPLNHSTTARTSSTRFNRSAPTWAARPTGWPPSRSSSVPCHGSGFYISGINFEGPAPRPLERFKVIVADDGQIIVDKSQKFQQELGQWSDPDSFIPV